MNILLFEWLVGGGLRAEGIVPPVDFFQSVSRLSDPTAVGTDEPDIEMFLRQGSAMVLAVAEDMVQAGHHVVLPIDASFHVGASSAGLPGLEIADTVSLIPIGSELNSPDALRKHLVKLAADVDAVLVIAPETDGCLATAVQWFESTNKRPSICAPSLISPGLDFVRLASDKQAIKDWLRQRQFGELAEDWSVDAFSELVDLNEATWPVVAKPIDGAGSESVQLIATEIEWRTWLERPESSQSHRRLFIERFVHGIPVSVSVIAAGSKPAHFLPPTGQIFDAEPLGHYVRAQWPLAPELTNAAATFAQQVVSHLPSTHGYFGIDMIISHTDSGNAPVATLIEINPRITMSYVRLRELVDENLAVQMLRNID
ncbi:MAG: ATP-grasp domain-containing protein [Planctomycetota bacterium]